MTLPTVGDQRAAVVDQPTQSRPGGQGRDPSRCATRRLVIRDRSGPAGTSGTLQVTGTEANDEISITRSGANIVLDRNGVVIDGDPWRQQAAGDEGLIGRAALRLSELVLESLAL